MTTPPDNYNVPLHVPPALVRDFNLYDYPVVDGDVPCSLHSLLTADGPETFWSPYNGGHWIVTRAATIEAVINDAQQFSNRYIGVPKALNPVRLFRPFQLDPPAHLPYRRLLGEAFSPRAMDVLRRDARQLTTELIESFQHRGECEFVSEFAHHMPIGLFMSMVGLPAADRLTLLSIAEKIARPRQDQDRIFGYAALDDYILALIRQRRGSSGNDLVTQLCDASIDGKPLTDEELIGMIALLLIAGLDTVAGMLTYFARYFARHPERVDELRSRPDRINHAVEELLRRFTHVNLARELRRDVELDGAQMKQGDMVVAPLALYSLDETKFAAPLSVDFDRPAEPGHMAFGGQNHRCLGAVVARMELRLFLEEWLTRIPSFSIRPGTTIEARTRVTAIIPKLPLVWGA